MNSGILTDMVDTIEGDTQQYSNTYVEFLQDNMNEINYKPRGKKKVAPKNKGVENFYQSTK